MTSISAANASVVLTPDPITTTGTIQVASIASKSVFVNNSGSTASPSTGVALAAGEVLYYNGTNLAALAVAGSTGTPVFLQCKGAGQALSWGTPSTGTAATVFTIVQTASGNTGPGEVPVAATWTTRSLTTLNPTGSSVTLATPNFTLASGMLFEV